MIEFDVGSQELPVQSLVAACDWVLARHASGLTIRGCPISAGFGSPLAVAVKTASSARSVFVAGSALELDLPNPERYKSGKQKLSVLVIGFYCSKKKYDAEGAVYHVSGLSALPPVQLVLFLGDSSCWLEQATGHQG